MISKLTFFEDKIHLNLTKTIWIYFVPTLYITVTYFNIFYDTIRLSIMS